MTQIDLPPDGYRKQDRETGRWLQNVNRRLCFWGAMAMLLMIGAFVWVGARDGLHAGVILGPAVMGIICGWLFALSLKRPDW